MGWLNRSLLHNFCKASDFGETKSCGVFLFGIRKFYCKGIQYKRSINVKVKSLYFVVKACVKD